jgi:CBS domain-containing protein
MKVDALCRRQVVSISASAALSEAARLMCEQQVGALIVTAAPADSPIAVGMLTDRDIVRAQLDGAADLSQIRVGDVMTREPLVLSEDEPLHEAVRRMRARGVRRAPVIGAGGALTGVISFDDVLAHIGTSLGALARLTGRQSRRDDLATYQI